MSSNVPIGAGKQAGAPTPVNTPLTTSVLAGGNAPPTLSRPTVPDVEEDDEGGDEGALRRELLGALVQDRIQGLIGRSSGYIEGLPDDVKKTIEGLKGVDAEYLAIFKQFKKESLELETKYATKYATVFSRRAAIIAGEQKPTDADIAKGVEVSKEDDEEYTPIAASVAPSAQGIKDFWLTALRNHVGISELVTERDEKALTSLKDVRVSLLPVDTPGYRLEFEFAENEFFSNTTLHKVYYYEDELDYQGDYVYKKAEGCDIQWKDDEKNLTKSFEIKKQRNKNTNRTRLVRKAHPAESFFNFFSPPTPPGEDDEDDEDEDQLQELEERLELDYQIGEDLKERVIPRAIDFFTGKALEYEDFEDEDDDYEDLDEDDEDDDEEDSDDDESPQLRRRAPAAGSNAPNAEECKQQ